MIELSRCTGHCCRAFTLPHSMEDLQADYQKHLEWEKDQTKPERRWNDIEIIAPMLIFLGIGAWDSKTETFQPMSLESGGRYQYSCKHFDDAAGNCTNYEGRPKMCRTYPDGMPCQYAKCTRKVECETIAKEENKESRQSKSC